MFERKFKAIIQEILGEFIEDFDDNELQVDNWSGQVTQSQLNIKPEGLRFLSSMLGVDLTVEKGVIGSLSLSFNWRALWSQPIRLTLEDLYVVCTPKQNPEPTLFLEKKRRAKRSKLEDLMNKKKFESPKKTYLKQLETTIADNVCISLKNVHLRFEDTISNPYRPFVIGITLESLLYTPCDSKWQKNFITLQAKRDAQKSFMILELNQFAVYHIPKCSDLLSLKPDWLKAMPSEKFAGVMYPFIAHKEYCPSVSEYYLLKPVSAEIRVRRSLVSSTEQIPQTSVSIIVEEIACALETNQYQDLLMLANTISSNHKVGTHLEFRPQSRPKHSPKEWWVYTLNLVHNKVKSRLRPFNWDYFEKRTSDKLKYSSIYQHKLVKEYQVETGRTLPNFQTDKNYSSLSVFELDKLLLDIEDRHTVEEIYLFRNFAERELSKLKGIPRKKGWLEWSMSWFSGSASEEEEAFMNTLLEYSNLINDDAHYLKSFVNFELKKCSVSLGGRQLNGLLASFLRITFDEVVIHRQHSKDSYQTYLHLSSLRASDPFTPIGRFSKLVMPKNIDENYLDAQPGFEVEEEIFPLENDGFPEFSKHELKINPVFEMVMNTDNSHNATLEIDLQPLEVVYNKYCIERIIGFLKIPEALSLYEALEVQTMSQLASWKLRTQARMEHVLKSQLNLNANINVNAPVVIIPQNPNSEDTTQVVVDLGFLKAYSKPRGHIYERLLLRKYSEEIDENEFYDHFNVKLSDINVKLLHPETGQSWNPVENFDINLEVSKSIVPKDPHLTTFKVRGEIENLTAKISQLQYYLLQQYHDSDDVSVTSSLKEEINYKLPSFAVDEEDEEEFYDATDPYEELKVEKNYSFNKEHLQVDFGVRKLNVVLLEDSEEEQTLMSLEGNDLKGALRLEEARYKMGVKIGALSLKDWAGDHVLVQSDFGSSDFLKVEVTHILESHPDFRTSEFDIFVSTSVSHFYLNYRDESVKLLLSFFKKQEAPSLPPISSEIEHSVYFELELKDIACKLSGYSKEVTNLNLSAAQVEYSTKNLLKCDLGKLTIEDCENNCLFFETLAQNLVHFEVSELNKEVSVEVNSFKIVMLMELLENLVSFFSNSVLNTFDQNLHLKNTVAKPNKYSVKAQILHPVLEFLKVPFNSESCVVDLGTLRFSDTQKERYFALEETQIYTVSQEATKEYLVKNFGVFLKILENEIDLKLPKLAGSFSLSQVNLVLELLDNYKKHFEKLKTMLEQLMPQETDTSLESEEGSAKQKVNAELSKIKLAWVLEEKAVCVVLNDIYILKEQLETKITCIDAHLSLESPQQVLFLPQVQSTHSPLFFCSVKELETKSVYFSLQHPRFILTPYATHCLLEFASQARELTPHSNKQEVDFQVSGEVNNLQVCVTDDSAEDLASSQESSCDFEHKRYLVLALSLDYTESVLGVKDLTLSNGKSCVAENGLEIAGKNIIHPVNAYLKDSKLEVGDLGVDFLLSHLSYFQQLSNQFLSYLPKSGSTSELPKLEVSISQVLLSLSHDFTFSKNAQNTYFMFKSDNISLKASNTSSAEFSFEVFYFNHQLLGWEPLLESTLVSVDFNKVNLHKKLAVTVNSDLNINITTAFLNTLSHFARDFESKGLFTRAGFASESKPQVRWGSGYWIRNETGQMFKYWVGDRLYYLENAEEHGLDFSEEEAQGYPVNMFKLKLRAQKNYKVNSISLQIGELPKLREISIDRLGCKVYNIPQLGGHFQVLCDVMNRQGDKILVIRSPIQIKNNLKVPVDLRFGMPFSGSKKHTEDFYSIVNVPPQSTVPLPITNSYFRSLQLRITGYSWSEKHEASPVEEPFTIECPHKGFGSIPGLPDIISQRKRHNSEPRSSYAVFKYCTHEFKEDTEKFFVKVFTLDPPLVMQNLLSCQLEYKLEARSQEMPPASLRSYGTLERGTDFEWVELPPNAKIGLSLRIAGFDWSEFLALDEENKYIYQFSESLREQVNVIVETFWTEGVIKLQVFAQYWIENLTGLPLMFKYIERNFDYDVISLPYCIEGVYFDDFSDKKKKGVIESVVTAFGETLETQEKVMKPWLRYKQDLEVGFNSLLEEEDIEEPTVRMFSVDPNSEGQAQIQIANSEWSAPFNINSKQGKKSMLSISGNSIIAKENTQHLPCLYEVAINLQIPDDPFTRTRLIKFTPRFIIVNKLGCVALVTQWEPTIEQQGVCRLLPNEKSKFHWPDAFRERAICVKFEEEGWHWSGKFFIDEPDDFVLRVKNSYSHQEVLVHVTITLEDSTLHVILQDTSFAPPYRIENLSMETIKLHQANVPKRAKILKPFEVALYAWDEPMKKKAVKLFIHSTNPKGVIPLGQYKLDYPKSFERIKLKAHDTHPPHFLYLEITGEGSSKVLTIRHDKSQQEYEMLQPYQTNELSLCLSLPCLGFSFINSAPHELVYASLTDINLKVQRDSSDIWVELGIDSVQLDNQMYRTSNPVILNSVQEVGKFLKVDLHKRRSKISNDEVEYFKLLKINLAPIDVKLDGFFIESFLNFLYECSEISASLLKPSASKENKKQRYYFDKIQINNAFINLTFSSIPSMFTSTNLVNPLRILFIIFTNIGNVFLEFETLKLTHRHLPLDLLLKEVTSFYLSQCKNQTLNILGSSDALGNPNEFIRHLKTGLIDFLTFSGQPNLTGFIRGTSSIVRHTVFGASNSASKMLEALKKGIHSVYIDEHSNQSKVWKVVMAMARVSLLLPNIAVSAASSTASQLCQVMEQQHPVLRRRPPRSFLTSRLLTPYSYSESVGQYVLSMVEHGKYLSEGIKFHITLDSWVIVLTSKRILCAVVEKYEAKWQVMLVSITRIKKLDEGLEIYYVNSKTPGFQQDRVEITGKPEQLTTLYDVLRNL